MDTIGVAGTGGLPSSMTTNGGAGTSTMGTSTAGIATGGTGAAPSNAGAPQGGTPGAGASSGGGADTSEGGTPSFGGSAGTAAGGSTGTAGMAAGGHAAGGSTPTSLWTPEGYAATVENTTANCEVAELAEPAALPLVSTFPDPFIGLDGVAITSKGEWPCRRQEVLKQAERYIYGDKPTPDAVRGTVTSSQVTVQVEAEGTSIEFSAEIRLPSTGEPPYPAIMNVGNRGGFGGLSLGEDRLLGMGVAVIYYNHYELGAEGTPEQSRGEPNPGSSGMGDLARWIAFEAPTLAD